MRRVVAALAILGLAVAGCLTYSHFADVSITCTSGGCETVQASRYSELAGIPVSVLGIAAYAFILGTAFFAAELARAAGATIAVASALFASYLVYVQIAVIGAVCDWCLASDVLIALLALACVERLRVGVVRQSRSEIRSDPDARHFSEATQWRRTHTGGAP
jgi:uncharacterized membrane protein